jgi:hypothetical protein
VSEPTRGPDQKPTESLDAERLRQQAAELLQEGHRPPEVFRARLSRATRIVYAAILILMIGSALFLLVSRNSRVGLIRAIANSWSGLYPLEQRAEVYKLPPPPPKAVEPKVVLQGSPTFAYQAPPRSVVPTVRAGTSEGEETSSVETETKPPAPPEKTAEAKAAYDFLIAKSDVARRLANNNFPQFRFQEWRPVRNSPPEFWVDLVVLQSDGREAHFIWQVNAEADTVRPLSQDARDLERR